MTYPEIPRTSRYRLSANLWLDEYIYPAMYKQFGSHSIWFLNPNLVKVDQFLRDRFGSVTINNWWIDGNRTLSGIRPFDSGTGASFSQHIFGNASDKIFTSATAEEVRADIIKNYKTFYQPLGLTCIEMNVSWVHGDCRNTGLNNLMTVYP
jgi:hypothetical protein